MSPDQRIIYVNDDDSVSVVIPSPDFIYKKMAEGLNAGQILQLLKNIAVPSNKHSSSVVLNKTALPVKSTFRNAWRLKDDEVQINIPAAREIKMDAIRTERDKRLDETDAEHLRLSEIGTELEKQTIRDKRQALRDLPADAQNAVDALNDPDDLEDYQPSWPE